MIYISICFSHLHVLHIQYLFFVAYILNKFRLRAGRKRSFIYSAGLSPKAPLWLCRVRKMLWISGDKGVGIRKVDTASNL